MAWTAPMTAVTGVVFTAAQFNQYIRDNLLMTAPAIATAAGRMIVTLGSKIVGERVPTVDFIGTSQDTATATYTDLGTVGPAVTVTTGTKAFVIMGSFQSNTNAGLGNRMSVAVSGATTSAASDTNSFGTESGNADDGFKGTYATIMTLTGGSNTFTAKYRTTAGGGTSTFSSRLVAVIPF